jgi:hypothetical protein
MTTTESECDFLLRRIRWLLGFFIGGLVLSGVTAIPIETELKWLVNLTGARTLVESSGVTPPSGLGRLVVSGADSAARY